MEKELNELLLAIYVEVCEEHYGEGDVDQRDESLKWLSASKNVLELKKQISQEFRLARARAYHDLQTKAGSGNDLRRYANAQRRSLENQVWDERK